MTGRRSRRGVLLVAAAVALVGACSDDDDDPPIGDSAVGVCASLDPHDLGAAVGEVFDDVEANDTTCTYRAAGSAAIVGLSFTELDAVPPGEALALLRESCDEGTVQDLDLAEADAAFGCRVQGELSVAAAGDDHLAVVAALGLDAEVSDAVHFEAVGAVLDPLVGPPAAQKS